MKKCVFIIPYFGKLPDSLPVFLKTCAPNKDFDFLFFTDDQRKFDHPGNVKVVYMSFEDLRALIQSKFDFAITLNRPYKLCDYKPAYGYIFEEYLVNYPFWGHCDIDTILGDLGHFLTDDLLSKYDKLFCLGHMILYRNTFENNRTFMMKACGKTLYKEYFSTEEITAFDETWGTKPSINTIFLENNKRVLNEDWSLNFKIFPTAFTRVRYNAEKDSFITLPREKTVYTWQNGKIICYSIKNGQIISHEEMYMHFQSRKMRYDKRVLKLDSFKAVPNKFLLLKRCINSKQNFKKESRYHISLHYFEIKWGRLMKRIRKIFQRSF